MSLYFTLALLTVEVLVNISAKTVENIFKRELRWNSANQNIESDDNSGNFQVRYFQPNNTNDSPILDNQNYMAFTLYNKNSVTGTFFFVLTNKVMDNPCSTRHAQAYYHFFKRCPDNEKNLIASGWCYQGSNGNGLVFNSDTFNKKDQDYLDKQYYLSNDRTAHSFEKTVLSNCFEEWKSRNFPLSSWTYSLDSSSSGRRKRSTVKICSECTCDAPLIRCIGLLTLSMVITSLLII